jgi:hypothetical protein
MRWSDAAATGRPRDLPADPGVQPLFQLDDLGCGRKQPRQAAERLQENPLGGGQIWCNRKGEPVGVALELPRQLIDSIPVEAFHATIAQANAPA